MTNTKRIKVLSLGDIKSGKTCLIKRYCERRFERHYNPTVGIDYGVSSTPTISSLESATRSVDLYDLSGDDSFIDVRNEFYHEMSAAFLVFDVSERDSFDSLEGWLSEARRCGMKKDVPIALCANKLDLPSRVTEKEAKEFATKHNLIFFETSACDGTGVDTMFQQVFRSAL